MALASRDGGSNILLYNSGNDSLGMTVGSNVCFLCKAVLCISSQESNATKQESASVSTPSDSR